MTIQQIIDRYCNHCICMTCKNIKKCTWKDTCHGDLLKLKCKGKTTLDCADYKE